MARKFTTTGIDKAVTDVTATEDVIERVVNATVAIAALRDAVSRISELRVEAVIAAKEAGATYSAIGEAAGMSTGRVAAIATGRGRYVPVAERDASPKVTEEPAADVTITATGEVVTTE